MKIYNSMTRQKEDFIPIVPGKAGIYACGPTVYNLIHIGNGRMLVVFDTLRRYLEFKGFDVTFVMNITDIEDKIIKRANEEGFTADEIAARYTDEFFTDMKGLNAKPATVHPKATEHIPEMIEMIGSLIEKGFAYATHDGVYFRAKRFSDYGKLSHQPLDDLEAGARVDVDELKEDPMDFALWKSAKPGEPSWPSPWGDGRPGWHIECSVMSNKHLGKTIDIHCGGVDLVFPHHENEIAQSEAANGCKFVNLWMHNGYINFDNKKMSKSLGNFFTVRDAAKEYGYEAIRFFTLAAHYRSPLNYSVDSLVQAQNALQRLYTTADNLDFLADNAEIQHISETEETFLSSLDAYRKKFTDAMDDDFNTADAIAAVFEMARSINTTVTPPAKPSAEFAKRCRSRFTELTGVLGLLYAGSSGDKLQSEVEALIEARQTARKNKDFKEADRIRDQLKDMGIILEDTPQGVKWRKRK